MNNHTACDLCIWSVVLDYGGRKTNYEDTNTFVHAHERGYFRTANPVKGP